MDHTRSTAVLTFFITVVVLSIIAVFLLISKCRSDAAATGDQSGASTTQSEDTKNPDMGDSSGNTVKQTDTGAHATPEELVGRISEVTVQANDTGNVQPLIDLLGKNNLSANQQEHLRKLASTSKLRLNQTEPFSAVQGGRDRWALNLFDKSRIFLDLQKDNTGNWKVGKIILPGNGSSIAGQGDNPITPGDPANPDDAHAAAVAVKSFMEAILKLNPAEARKHIDTDKVSYAKLAGLCIIFEEGDYKLIKDRPLRKMFLRDTTAGWLTRVQAADTGETAMFAINTKRKDANSPWKITEINLDKLLADYANRFSGGDIHYTPLIRNPKGGDSLVIYFDLDSENLTARTQRQLTIVANLLKSDADKKLTISGHTDALGSDAYNLALSEKRARQVMQFFTEKGVPTTQMKIIGFGKAKPRLPNQTDDGADNPDGRRVNRRAEILLDF